MRIIAGKYKGRKLHYLETKEIRPTMARTREALFNVLMHGKFGGDAVIDQHVMDLCCGTGALGIEALSRGAAKVTFVDKSRQALKLAQENVALCGATSAAAFVLADAAALPPASTPMALVLFDAPYDQAILPATYAALQRGGWLAMDSLLVVEQGPGGQFTVLEGTEIVDERKYGKTKIAIYQVLETL